MSATLCLSCQLFRSVKLSTRKVVSPECPHPDSRQSHGRLGSVYGIVKRSPTSKSQIKRYHGDVNRSWVFQALACVKYVVRAAQRQQHWATHNSTPFFLEVLVQAYGITSYIWFASSSYHVKNNLRTPGMDTARNERQNVCMRDVRLRFRINWLTVS